MLGIPSKDPVLIAAAEAAAEAAPIPCKASHRRGKAGRPPIQKKRLLAEPLGAEFARDDDKGGLASPPPGRRCAADAAGRLCLQRCG